MMEDNSFNNQRRNLIIINCIMFIILISSMSISEFTIFTIPFKINEENSILTNYNILFEVAWIYLNIRYISTLIYKLNKEPVLFKKKNKINELVNSEVHIARQLLKDKSILLRLFAIWFILLFSTLKTIFKLLIPLFDKAIIEYIIPLLLSTIVFFMYYPKPITVVVIVIMFFFIGMSIDSRRYNFKKDRYIVRKRKSLK